MKNAAIVLLLITTVLFGSLYVGQKRKLAESEAHFASVRQAQAELEAQVSRQQERTEVLQTKLHDTRAKAVEKADEVTQLQQALTNQVTAEEKKSNPFADMFKDPGMKDLIKNQQKVALGGLVDKNYGAFATSLGLSPVQTAGLKDLVVQKSLIDAQTGMSLLSGDLDSDKRKEIVQQAKTDKEAVDAQIKQYLGDDAYTQFQTYEKTIPERMSVNMFKDQLASGPNALGADQETQLIQSLSELRQNFKFTTDYADQSKMNGDLASFFTDDKLAQFQQEKMQLDQQYVEKAKGILSADQLPEFERFLISQRDMQSAGMKMAQSLFGGKPKAN